MTSNRNKNSLGVVCFDLGGVVIRIRRGFAAWCDAAGVSIDLPQPESFERALGALSDRYHRGDFESEEFFTRISELSDRIVNPTQARAIFRTCIVEEYEGMASTIDHSAATRSDA